jgi:hypothetical protein
VPDATFATPDVTTFCRLDELGLVVVGQHPQPDRAVPACRVADDAVEEADRWCRRCGCEGRPRDTVTRRLAHEPVGWRPTTLLLSIRRYRCAGCGHVWREDTSRAAEPRAKLTRTALRWALVGLVCQHLTVARLAEALAVSWSTANTAVLAEGQRVLLDDPTRFDGVRVLTDPDLYLTEDVARTDDPKQRRERRPGYRRLQRERFFYPLAAQFLYMHVPIAIPCPARTERTFWAVSAMPATNRSRQGGRLFTLSVNKMETFFLFAGEMDGDPFYGGVINVSQTRLLEKNGSLAGLRRRFPSLGFRSASYESGGGDVTSITFMGMEGYFQVLDVPGAVEAARALTMMLMRKGPTLQWRYHSYDLADWAFAEQQEIDALWDAATVGIPA